jgi:phage gp36-like protein
MKKILIGLVFILAFSFSAFSDSNAEEGIMGYCTLEDLSGAYGADRIAGWSRRDPDAAERAIRNASSEIDGYLISGGYIVPLQGPPENLRKYCIDIAAAALVLNAGVLENDPGGKAVLEEAKNARRYLTKVAEGKFRIPGAANFDKETSKLPAGGVRISASPRLDLGRF